MVYKCNVLYHSVTMKSVMYICEKCQAEHQFFEKKRVLIAAASSKAIKEAELFYLSHKGDPVLKILYEQSICKSCCLILTGDSDL